MNYLLPTLPSNEDRRFYKFTILTPHTFLPPDHPESLEDDLAETFADFLSNRVAEVLGARVNVPHVTGEAFLNMEFDAFEERYLRHSEFAIWITSGDNAGCLDLIYPRMLVFLTIRPTWRNRAFVVYLGNPRGQKLFDQHLFAIEPLTFSLRSEEWESPGGPWNQLLGTLRTQVPLTPEIRRSNRSNPQVPSETSSFNRAQTNKSPSDATFNACDQPKRQAPPPIDVPLRAKHCGTITNEVSRATAATPSVHFSISKSFSVVGDSSSQHLDQTAPDERKRARSKSLDDMCFFGRPCWNSEKMKRSRMNSDDLIIQNTSLKKAEHAMNIKRQRHNSDLLCLFAGMRKPKSPSQTPSHIDSTKSQLEIEAAACPEIYHSVLPESSTPKSHKPPMNTFHLQVQVVGNGTSGYNTISPSISRRTATLSMSDNRRQKKQRLDSGIMSSYGCVSQMDSHSSPVLTDLPRISSPDFPTQCISASSPSYLDYTGNDWTQSNEGSKSQLVFGSAQTRELHSPAHSISSLDECHIHNVKGPLRYADDGHLSSDLISSESSRNSIREPFMKPGIPPIHQNASDDNGMPIYPQNNGTLQHSAIVSPTPTGTAPFGSFEVHQVAKSRIMNPDSRASSVTIDDHTLGDVSDVELPQDYISQPLSNEANNVDENFALNLKRHHPPLETDIDKFDHKSQDQPEFQIHKNHQASVMEPIVPRNATKPEEQPPSNANRTSCSGQDFYGQHISSKPLSDESETKQGLISYVGQRSLNGGDLIGENISSNLESQPTLLETDIDNFDSKLPIHDGFKIKESPRTPEMEPVILQSSPKSQEEALTNTNLRSRNTGLRKPQSPFSVDEEARPELKTQQYVHQLLQGAPPEHLKLIQEAIKTYEQYPSLSPPYIAARTEMSQLPITPSNYKRLLDSKSSSSSSKHPSTLWLSIPSIISSVLNLYHPDNRLQRLTETAQNAVVNHRAGVPILLIGTTLASPHLLRQFPLTVVSSCVSLTDALHAVACEPGAFFSERFSDLVGVMHAAPTWATFSLVGSLGAHWRRVRPS